MEVGTYDDLGKGSGPAPVICRLEPAPGTIPSQRNQKNHFNQQSIIYYLVGPIINRPINNFIRMDTGEKTRKFLIATHGRLASGVKSSLDLIIGVTENLFLIEAYTDENRPVEAEIKAIVDQLTDSEELVIFSDILGGSVTNQLLQQALKPGIYIVSGFNLPLVMEIMLADTDTPLDEVIEQAIESAAKQMVFVNKLVAAANDKEQHD